MKFISKVSFDDKHFKNGIISSSNDNLIVHTYVISLNPFRLIYKIILGCFSTTWYNLHDIDDYLIFNDFPKQNVKIYFKDGRFLRFGVKYQRVDELIAYLDQFKCSNVKTTLE